MRPGNRLVAVIPAAGLARRLAGVASGSKEVLTIGPELAGSIEWGAPGSSRTSRQTIARSSSQVARSGRPVATFLLEALELADVPEAWIVLRPGKEDVEQVLGAVHGRLQLRYHYGGLTRNAVETVGAVIDRLAGATVVLGFPDIVVRPPTAIRDVLAALRAESADLALGCFPTEEDEKTDMVRFDEAGRPVEIRVKQPAAGLRFNWCVAAWGPRFTELLRDFLARGETALVVPPAAGEIYFGDLVRTALARGLRTVAQRFEHGVYLDVGTASSLAEARRRFSS